MSSKGCDGGEEGWEVWAQVTGCFAEGQASLNTRRYHTKWKGAVCVNTLWEFVQRFVKANVISFNNLSMTDFPFLTKIPTNELDHLDVNITAK